MSAAAKPTRILVVDDSRVARRLIADVILQESDDTEIVACVTGAQALEKLAEAPVSLVTTALRLPDMDGLELSRRMREAAGQYYFPIIVVSGDVTQRLHQEGVLAEVTDYFDKSHGFRALGAFISGYLNPDPALTGKILLVEDSKVISIATERVLRKQGLDVVHAGTVDAALEYLRDMDERGSIDLVLTDVNLKGGKSGHDLLRHLRGALGVTREQLPVLVITGESSSRQHAELLRTGANDLVEKPIREPLLVAKLRFQLQLRHQAIRTKAVNNQ